MSHTRRGVWRGREGVGLMLERPHFAVANFVKVLDDFVQIIAEFRPLLDSFISFAGYPTGQHI
ncbi:hypothetical protein A4249_07585 [Brevundimonas sp. GW460-12-10-14-LB2]|nr:hypothetical protein A4249_07585 [Brevundimonas sp. GW460-12-10-14-LB2]